MTAERLLKSTPGEGATLTGRVETVVRLLRERKDTVTAIPFGKMVALFCLVLPESEDALAEMKVRGPKPFVVTTSPEYSENLISHPGVSLNVTDHAREVWAKILANALPGHPIGVLVEANTDKALLRNVGKINVGGSDVPTFGVMVSDPSKLAYRKVVEALSEHDHLLCGTSCNHTPEYHPLYPKVRIRDGGSGHHNKAGAPLHFGMYSNAVIFIPELTEKVGNGPSCATALLSNDGNVARLVRGGSIPQKQMVDILHNAGVQKVIIDKDVYKEIHPYTYSKTERSLLWGLGIYTWAVTRRKDTRMPIPLINAIMKYCAEVPTKG